MAQASEQSVWWREGGWYQGFPSLTKHAGLSLGTIHKLRYVNIFADYHPSHTHTLKSKGEMLCCGDPARECYAWHYYFVDGPLDNTRAGTRLFFIFHRLPRDFNARFPHNLEDVRDISHELSRYNTAHGADVFVLFSFAYIFKQVCCW